MLSKNFSNEKEILVLFEEFTFSKESSLIQEALGHDVYEDVKEFIKIVSIVSDELVQYGRNEYCSQEEKAEMMLAAGMKNQSLDTKNIEAVHKAKFGTATAVLNDLHHHYVVVPAHIVGAGEELSIEDKHGNSCNLGTPVSMSNLGTPVSVSKMPQLIDIALVEATLYPVHEATGHTPVKVLDTSILEQGSLPTHTEQPWIVQKIGATTGHTFGKLVSYSKWYGNHLHGDAIMVEIESEKGDSGSIVTSGARECIAISYVFGKYTAQLKDAHGKEERVSWVVSLPFKPALEAMQKRINKKLTLYDGNIKENDGVDASEMSVTMVVDKSSTL